MTVIDPAHRRTPRGIVCHHVKHATTEEIAGVHASIPDQLFVELADRLGFVDLVVVGDHLVRRLGRAPQQLAAAADARRRESPRAARAAAEAARFVRARVDSPMETRLRLLLVMAGLPEPEVNLLVGSDNGTRRRYDLCWRPARLIVEYDGRQHAEDPVQWRSDLARRQDIDDDG